MRAATFEHVAALDGLRALAVAAVLVFHSELGFADGGFLGVSVFFTLSGFLITTLLVREHHRSGQVALGAFYGRRARRLVPAAYACVAAVLLLTPFWSVRQRQDLPGDAIASVANVANWRFAFAGQSYQDLFTGTPSPLAHFWSLAIEEQCYLLLPLVVAWALRWGGARRLAQVLAVLLAGSLVATLLTHDLDLVYNGTHTRAAELLLGALAALVVLHRRPGERVLAAMSLVGLAALTVLVAVSGLDDRWLYRGGFVLVGVCSAVTVVGLLGSHRLARVVGCRPMVAVGRRSYGVYLYHWPVFLVLTTERTGWSQWPLLTVRLAVTACVAAASYRWLEMPVRARRVLRAPRPAGVALVLAASALVVSSVAWPAPTLSASEQLLDQVSSGTVTLYSSTTTRVGSTLAPVPDAPVIGGPLRIAVIGDSTSVFAAQALADAGADELVVQWAGEEACPFATTVATRAAPSLDWTPSECVGPLAKLDGLLDSFRPDAVLLVVGAMGLMEHRYPGDETGYLPGHPTYLAAHSRALDEVMEVLRPRGVPLVVADTPPLGVGAFSTFEMADPARADAFNSMIAAWTSVDVAVLPYGARIVAYEAERGNIRFDGSHPQLEPLTEIARDWLVGDLVDTVRSLRA